MNMLKINMQILLANYFQIYEQCGGPSYLLIKDGNIITAYDSTKCSFSIAYSDALQKFDYGTFNLWEDDGSQELYDAYQKTYETFMESAD